jgi:peptidoglycan/xylan/chitin deacetylase (PgdA/CDA1 family)
MTWAALALPPLQGSVEGTSMRNFKQRLLRLLFLPGATLPFSSLVRQRAVIFMMHRFRDRATGVEGHDPDVLRQSLAYIRKQRCEIISLDELLLRLLNGRPSGRTVVFTIDDGYADQATVGAPVFAEFDCPVTTFVTTGFLDRVIWFWWDQIEYILAHTDRAEIQAHLKEVEYKFALDGPNRSLAKASLLATCKELPDTERVELIRLVAAAAEVELPRTPPDSCLPMSWDQARACEKKGMSFGPHTVTHPILSRISEAKSRLEISGSWERLTSQVAHPVPVFGYPNGRRQDYTGREVATLKDLKFHGAVATTPGYFNLSADQDFADSLFHIPRFGFPSDLLDVVQSVSGFERFKQLLRRGEVE